MTRHEMKSVDELVRGMNRRALLRKGAGLAAIGVTPALLAACGGGGSSTASSSASTSSGSTTAEAANVGGTVNFIGFQGTDLLEPLKSFYKENGITVESSYVGSMSELVPKFAGGGSSGIDMVNYNAPGNIRLQQSGIKFEPLDLERIPNWKYVEEFVELTDAKYYSNEAGEIVSVPYSWGALGITYDSKAIPEPKSWSELRDPKYKGKLTLIDDPSPNYDLTAEVLGFKPAEMTKEQMDQVTEFLKEILENAKSISTSYGDITNLISTGEVEVIYAGWSAINAFAAEAGNKNIKTNLEPEEGGGVFVEQYGIPEGGGNTDTVYAIMNHVLIPKVNAEAATSLLEATVSKGAQKYQPKSVIELGVPEAEWPSFFEKSSVSSDPPAISEEFVTFGDITEAWNQLKAEV